MYKIGDNLKFLINGMLNKGPDNLGLIYTLRQVFILKTNILTWNNFSSPSFFIVSSIACRNISDFFSPDFRFKGCGDCS